MNYLLLDKNDITHVCGKIRAKDLREQMGGITNSSLCSFVKKGEPWQDKYILIEEEFRPEKEVFLETINGVDYYLNNQCKVFHIKKNGEKYFHSTVKSNGRYIVRYGNKNHNLARIVAKSFVKRDLNENDVVTVKNGELKIKNIVIMSKQEAGKIHSKMSGRNKRIGLFENDVLVEEFYSMREVERKLYISRFSVSQICKGKVKKKIYDLRFI